VAEVRQGKFFELDLVPGTSAADARHKAEEIAEKVLSNPVIESFRVEIDP
jgi:phosphoribosylformylglycinamidine (FGAM) synthase PurS component